MKRNTAGTHDFALGAFTSCLLLLALVAGISIWSDLRSYDELRWIRQAYQVKGQIAGSLSIMQDAVINARSFVITGRKKDLEHYQSSRARIEPNLDALSALTSDNPQQGLRIEQLRSRSLENIAVLQRAIQARGAGDFLGAIRVLSAFNWSESIDECRAIMAQMDAGEDVLLKKGEAAALAGARITTVTLVGGVGLIVVSGCMAIVRINRDCRARKIAEESIRVAHRQLAEQADVLDSVLRSVGDGVVVADANGKFISWNPAASRIIGQGPADVTLDQWTETYGVYLADRVTPCPAEREPLALAMRGECVDGEILYLKSEHLPKGRWISVTGRPLTSKTGEIRGGTVVMNDITERMATQTALQKARDELEARIQERTFDLARSNQQLEQFAYVASHDLQQPLRMITSYVQLLAEHLKDRLDADSKEFIGYVVDGTAWMKRLINDLLSYSRIGSHGKPFEPTDCERVFHEAFQMLDAAIHDSGAKVTHDPLPTVMGDETHLVQLFQNLIENAIKYHGETPPAVHVGAERRGGEWIISVCDNGIGIDPQYADRIFLVFQRLHGKEQFSGTGIGLAICKKVVEGHGGRIWVESHPGQGSTFYFTMPYVEVPNDDTVRIRETDRALVGGGRRR